MKIRKFRGGLSALILLLSVSSALAGTLNVFNDPSYFAKRSGVKLVTGRKVQLIEGSSALAPQASGVPTMPNILLDEKTIGPDGEYALGATLSAGSHNIFVRVWDGASFVAGTYYGHSSIKTVNIPDLQPLIVYYTEDITADKVIATTSSLRPTPRGQGAQTQLITIEGQYFQSGATVTFSDMTGLTMGTTTVVDATRIHQIISLTPGATTGGRGVTVTNSGAIASDPPLTFTINAGPRPGTPSPDNYYRGDSGGMITINTANGGDFHYGVQGTLSGSGASFTVPIEKVSNTQVKFNAFSLTPSADPYEPTARTIRLTNPDDAGTDTVAFTVKNPSIVLGTTSGGRGNVFAPVVVTGTGTHFSLTPGVTTVTMESQSGKVNISNIVPISATSLTFNLSISPEAADGSKVVTVSTPGVVGETESKTANFNITKPTFGLNYSTGILGTTLVLTVTGSGTHFTQGNTTIRFSGTGVTAGPIRVASVTSFTTEVTIAPNAPTSPAQDVTVATANVIGGTETMTNNGAFTPAPPSLPALVTNLRALAEPDTGNLTLKWTDPATNYSGGKVVYTKNYADWDALTDASAEAADVPGTAGADSEKLLTGLGTTDVYYMKVFSYVESGIKFFGSSGAKVAALPKGTGGGGTPQLAATLEIKSLVGSGGHGINHFSMPFPGPLSAYTEGGMPIGPLTSAYDLVRAINSAAGGNIISTFAAWLGADSSPASSGVIIANEDPEEPTVKAALQAIVLENGRGYELYATRGTRLVIKNY